MRLARLRHPCALPLIGGCIGDRLIEFEAGTIMVVIEMTTCDQVNSRKRTCAICLVDGAVIQACEHTLVPTR